MKHSLIDLKEKVLSSFHRTLLALKIRVFLKSTGRSVIFYRRAEIEALGWQRITDLVVVDLGLFRSHGHVLL